GGDDLIDVASSAAQTKVTVLGGSGNDLFQIQPRQAGAVAVDGGAGTDTLTYFFYTTDVRVNLALGTAPNRAGGARNAENVGGGAGNDILVGNDSANVLWGGEGRDVLIGRGGADVVIAEGGDDILIGDRTSYDLTPARLEDLMREWSRTDLTGYAKTQYK